MRPGLLCWGNFLCEEEEDLVFFVLQAQGVFWILNHSFLSGLLSIRIRWIPQCWVGRVDASEHLEQCDYTFLDWGMLLLLVLFVWFGVVFLRGGEKGRCLGEPNVIYVRAHSIGLKSLLASELKPTWLTLNVLVPCPDPHRPSLFTYHVLGSRK